MYIFTFVSKAYDPGMRSQPRGPRLIWDPGWAAVDQLRLAAHIDNGQTGAPRAGAAAFHLAAACVAAANT
jgi:hypothetical protein